MTNAGSRHAQLRPETQTSVTGGATFTVVSWLSIQTWIASDGSGYQRTLVRATEFASDADRQAWRDAGSPDITQPGDVRLDAYGREDAPWYDVSVLPTDADALLSDLRAGEHFPIKPGDEHVFLQVGDLLAQGDASAELRAAVFEVLTRLDGVQDLGDVRDPIGREGVALALDGPEGRAVLIFDPTTAGLLSGGFLPLDSLDIATAQSWRAFWPATMTKEPPSAA